MKLNHEQIYKLSKSKKNVLKCFIIYHYTLTFLFSLRNLQKTELSLFPRRLRHQLEMSKLHPCFIPPLNAASGSRSLPTLGWNCWPYYLHSQAVYHWCIHHQVIHHWAINYRYINCRSIHPWTIYWWLINLHHRVNITFFNDQHFWFFFASLMIWMMLPFSPSMHQRDQLKIPLMTVSP